MTIANSIFASVLFFILTPSILLRLPSKRSKYIVAATHALIFGFIYAIIVKMTPSLEGFGYNNNDWFKSLIDAAIKKKQAETAASIKTSPAPTSTTTPAPTTTTPAPTTTTPAPTTTTPAPTTTTPAPATFNSSTNIDTGLS